MDCSIVPYQTTSARRGQICRIMIEKQKQVCDHDEKIEPNYNQLDVLRTRANYYETE